MRKGITHGLVFLVAALAAAVARDAAGGGDVSLDADAQIAACWAISEDDRASQNSGRQRNGVLQTALCLEKTIAEQGAILIYDGYLSKQKIAEKLERIRFAFGNLYWAIYNENNACLPSCGTLMYSRHNWELAKLYEKILRDMIDERKRRDL